MQHHRIVIIGPTCSGKTTLAKKISKQLNISHFELDSYYWQENRSSISTQKFRDKVKDFLSKNSNWIIDGNYKIVRDLIWKDAEIYIWLNYPFLKVFYRSLKRSILRGIKKEMIFSNNIETLQRSFFSKDSVILWLVKTYHLRKRGIPKLFNDYEINKDRVIEINKSSDIFYILSKIKRIQDG